MPVTGLAQLLDHGALAFGEQVVAGAVGLGEVAEQVLQQARPQVAFHVLPGVVLDLHDSGIERQCVGGSRQCWLYADEVIDAALQAAQEVTLAAAPLAEQPDRQRRGEALRGDQVRERIHLGPDPDQVGGFGGLILRGAPVARHIGLDGGQLHNRRPVWVPPPQKLSVRLPAGKKLGIGAHHGVGIGPAGDELGPQRRRRGAARRQQGAEQHPQRDEAVTFLR